MRRANSANHQINYDPEAVEAGRTLIHLLIIDLYNQEPLGQKHEVKISTRKPLIKTLLVTKCPANLPTKVTVVTLRLTLLMLSRDLTSTHEWILLIHQLPPKPTNLRVRIWRKLQKLGAVAIKNSVYVLPATEKSHEDFQWLKQEIESAAGEASVFKAASVEGATDQEIIASIP